MNRIDVFIGCQCEHCRAFSAAQREFDLASDNKSANAEELEAASDRAWDALRANCSAYRALDKGECA